MSIYTHFTDTQGLINVSVPAAFPRSRSLSTKPGVCIGLGMALTTAQVELLHSTASGIVTKTLSP